MAVPQVVIAEHTGDTSDPRPHTDAVSELSGAALRPPTRSLFPAQCHSELEARRFSLKLLEKRPTLNLLPEILPASWLSHQPQK